MTSRLDLPYVRWSNTRPPARHDLAGSRVLSCSIDDLEEGRGSVDLTDEAAVHASLVAAIARRYNIPSEGVTTAHGASGANFLVSAALLEPGDEVIVERPGYDALLGPPLLLGARASRFDRGFDARFEIDPERVARQMTPRTRLVVLTNPHNPSGVVSSRAVLEAIGRIAEANGAYVLVDEVYLDQARLGPHQSPAAHLGDAFISTSSLTKSYGLSGLRCGWALSSPAVAERLRRVRDVVDGSIPVVTDRLAAIAFSRIDRLLELSRALLAVNGAMVRDFLETRPELEWVEPEGGALVFPRIAGVADASTFARRLLTGRDTAVVPGRFFEAPAHFRLGFGGRTDAVRGGLEAIGAALDAREW